MKIMKQAEPPNAERATSLKNPYILSNFQDPQLPYSKSSPQEIFLYKDQKPSFEKQPQAEFNTEVCQQLPLSKTSLFNNNNQLRESQKDFILKPLSASLVINPSQNQINSNAQTIVKSRASLDNDFDSRRIVIIRHAQSNYNSWKKKCFFNCGIVYMNTQKNRDPLLSANGVNQTKQLQQLLQENDLNNEQIDKVYVSPLRRTIQTLIGSFDELQICKIRIQPLLRERLDTACDIGSNKQMLANRFPQIKNQILQIPQFYWLSHCKKWKKHLQTQSLQSQSENNKNNIDNQNQSENEQVKMNQTASRHSDLNYQWTGGNPFKLRRESKNSARQRAQAFKYKLLNQMLDNDYKTVVLITHSRFARFLYPFKRRLRNAQLQIIGFPAFFEKQL